MRDRHGDLLLTLRASNLIGRAATLAGIPPPRAATSRPRWRAALGPYEITEADRDSYAAWRGNVAAVHRALHAGRAGAPSLRGLQGGIHHGT